MDYPRGIRPMRGKIQIRYRIDGTDYAETLDLPLTRAGLTEASRIRKDRIRQAKFGEPGIIAKAFEVLAQDYLNSLDVALSTRNSYRDSLNIYWSALAGKDVAGITARDIIAIDDAMEWPSQKTRSNAIIPLRRCFRYAVSRGYRVDNPAEVLAGRRSATAGPDPYTPEERDTLLGWLDGTLAGPYYRVAFGTGARTGELIALQWSDFDGRTLHIHASRVRRQVKGTKTGKARKVLLLDDVLEVLRSMPRPIHGGHIFANQYGRPYQSGYHLNKWFRKAHKATGVRYRSGPYPWRSTYASLALSSGVKPSLVAAQLGHRVDVLLTAYAKYVPRQDDLAELGKMASRPEKLDQTWIGDR